MKISLDFENASPKDRDLLLTVMKSIVRFYDTDWESFLPGIYGRAVDRSPEIHEQDDDEDQGGVSDGRKKKTLRSCKRNKDASKDATQDASQDATQEPEAPQDAPSQEFACAPDPGVRDEETPQEEAPVPEPSPLASPACGMTPEQFRKSVQAMRDSLGITTPEESRMLATAISNLCHSVYNTYTPSKLPSVDLYRFVHEEMNKLTWNDSRTEIGINELPF